MNVLITGGAGFIGSHLSELHSNNNDTVFIVDNLITGNKQNINHLPSKNIILFEEDILSFDFGTLPAMDLIYHLASPASPVQYRKYAIETMRTNAEGTYRVLEFMKNSHSKTFIISSTSEIYGDPLEHPQKEEYFGNVNTLGPRACYDEGKRYAETICMNYHTKFNLDIRIARIFNTYGPRMEINDGRVISNFITQALQGKDITIYGDGSQTRSFCYVSDMVKGLYNLCTGDGLNGKVINIGNPDERSIKDIAELIKKMTHSESEIVYHPIDADDPKQRKPDITKAKKFLNWHPEVMLETGLTSTIDYFQNRLTDTV